MIRFRDRVYLIYRYPIMMQMIYMFHWLYNYISVFLIKNSKIKILENHFNFYYYYFNFGSRSGNRHVNLTISWLYKGHASKAALFPTHTNQIGPKWLLLSNKMFHNIFLHSFFTLTFDWLKCDFWWSQA